MPNMDGTGPMGKGPMSGRRIGRCGNQENRMNHVADPTTAQITQTDSFSGQGLGRGMGRRFNAGTQNRDRNGGGYGVGNKMRQRNRLNNTDN